MKVRKTKQYNDQKFIDDFRRVREIMVWVQESGTYLMVRKKEIAELSESRTIKYYLTDEIFTMKRTSMVIL